MGESPSGNSPNVITETGLVPVLLKKLVLLMLNALNTCVLKMTWNASKLSSNFITLVNQWMLNAGENSSLMSSEWDQSWVKMDKWSVCGEKLNAPTETSSAWVLLLRELNKLVRSNAEKEKELPDVTEEPEKLVETWLKTVVMLEEVQDKDLPLDHNRDQPDKCSLNCGEVKVNKEWVEEEVVKEVVKVMMMKKEEKVAKANKVKMMKKE